jgi:dTDP-4-amino-4,6-dideoxygalactose transaminase
MRTSEVARVIPPGFQFKELEQIHLSGSGAVRDLENRLQSFYRLKHALCVSNAGVGLMAIALALDLRGEEFITTAYTYGASLAGWLALGNRPVFADIDVHSLTLDPASVRSRMSSRTKAILAVDIYGIPSDTNRLREVADERGIWYIADAAQSLGATMNGAKASSRADALVLSFTTGKTVFAGEGGAVLTNNDDLYEKLLWHTQHPIRQRRELGLNLDNEFGVNARIHPLAAILANAGFDRALRKLRKHQDRCFKILSALNGSGLTDPIRFEHEKIVPSFFRLTAAWTDGPQESALSEELRRMGFEASLAPAPVRLVYRQPSFQAQYGSVIRGDVRCPTAERQADSRFCVVMNPGNEPHTIRKSSERR